MRTAAIFFEIMKTGISNKMLKNECPLGQGNERG